MGGGQATNGWDHLLWESWPPKTSCKDFHLATGGGLGWVKCLKNELGKGFIFHTIIPALCPFWWKFDWLMKESLYSACLNLIKGETK